ncbi:MAG TPA: MOSC domain-containing protein [Alphaproteobacteria bacterium]|jgi:MOSC domain-containing protein YiiM|nr:MOSC domain-containing protein [Alphaproteobacteria bacterium]
MAIVVAVSRSGTHTFTKPNERAIRLITGLGVEGDAHLGTTVQHRVDIRRNPDRPNLRQVHLIHEELQEELRAAGFKVFPGTVGENVTTRGIALLDLPTGTRLKFGAEAVIEITGLRKPCRQLNDFQQGLMDAVIGKDADGNPVYRCGVMAVVVADGEVRTGDAIDVALPPLPHRALTTV